MRPGYKTPEYKAWISMKDRCEGTRHNFRYIGIKVCKRWRESFEAFLADVGKRPSAQYSLDRYPKANGDYKPGNVRWATRKQQARNWRTRQRLITFNGTTQPLSAWAEAVGVEPEVIGKRLDRGWPKGLALTSPASRHNQVGRKAAA